MSADTFCKWFREDLVTRFQRDISYQPVAPPSHLYGALQFKSVYHTHVKISRRPSAAQEENTPLLSYHDTDDGRGRWSLARRRSSAFLSFLSEPEDREGDEYRKFQRKITIYRIVFINLIYCIGVGIMNSFFIELIQTLACAEYYYDSSSPDSRFPTLPSAGDPSDLCSVAWVDKRTSQIATYADVLASVTGCLASLVLAKKVLPRFGRRTVVIGCVTVSLMFAVGLASLPTHYSFDPAIASTSTVHPTASLYLLLASCSLAGLLGAPQVAMPILSKVMVLDTCEEDEKTADFSMAYSSNALGMAFSAKLLRLVLPPLNINFSILHHSGPFSPFWMMAGVFALALVLVLLYLPETKPNLVATNKSRRSSLSSSHSEPDDIDGPSRETQPLLAARSTHPSRSRASNALRSIQDLLSPFGYLIPYKPHPEAKRDYKLPLMLCAMVFCDTISMIWSNLIVFCSTHLHFGPQDVTTLLGLIGSTKGVYTLLVLPHIVTLVRRMVKRRIREEVLAETAASMEEPSTETRIAKREKSIIITDRIVAIGGLLSDIIGFICMGLAASHLSTAGIYVSVCIVLFAAGAYPAVQALNVDYFLAQNRPTDDPVAARDAFVGFLDLILNLSSSFGPIVNNAIYFWSIDHAVPGLVFFWTATLSTTSLVLVASVGLFFS